MTNLTSKSGKTILVRPLESTDVDLLWAYIKELGQEDTFLLTGPDEIPSHEEEYWYVNHHLRLLKEKKALVLLAFDGPILMGSCDVTTWQRRQKHVGRLGISIKKEYRRDGIGEQLMRHMLSQAQSQLDCKIIMLSCFADNLPAQAMYKKLGFTDCGRLPGGIWYKNQYQDQVFMYKALNEVTSS